MSLILSALTTFILIVLFCAIPGIITFFTIMGLIRLHERIEEFILTRYRLFLFMIVLYVGLIILEYHLL